MEFLLYVLLSSNATHLSLWKGNKKRGFYTEFKLNRKRTQSGYPTKNRCFNTSVHLLYLLSFYIKIFQFVIFTIVKTCTLSSNACDRTQRDGICAQIHAYFSFLYIINNQHFLRKQINFTFFLPFWNTLKPMFLGCKRIDFGG